MNIVDAIIILFILCGGVIGLKRGVFKELVMTVGYLALIIISWFLKNPIAEFLSLHLPFFEFGGDFQGLVVLNILLYQVIAFILVFAILGIIFNLILEITKVFEKLLDYTIILGFISKILGLVVGLLEGYLIMFLVCVLLSYPIFNQDIISESKLKPMILESTPILSNIANAMTETVDEVVELAKTDIKEEKEEFNKQALDIMLKHELIKPDYVEKLIKAEKLELEGAEEILEKYK